MGFNSDTNAAPPSGLTGFAAPSPARSLSPEPESETEEDILEPTYRSIDHLHRDRTHAQKNHSANEEEEEEEEEDKEEKEDDHMNGEGEDV